MNCLLKDFSIHSDISNQENVANCVLVISLYLVGRESTNCWP